ncbi:MAG: VapC toxin family PIN domain ribonuclease [Nitrososphaeria archaeon]|nr:VapC toxin family PIN domain ribonuclease [Nitrososphaeria archaeon]
MLLESDVLISYIKKDDWLKSKASSIINAIENGSLKPIQISTEAFHDYIFSEYAPLQTILLDFAIMSTIKNITYIRPDCTIYLMALTLMDVYNLTSIFDAIYAATVLSTSVADHTIISTNKKYDEIKGLKRIDSREL